ncbi:MAG TPA: hypothetical protein VF680_17015 [Allosphingosinicella sp.]|jgi:hypothetical protein
MSDKKQVFLSLETARKMWKEELSNEYENTSIRLFLLDNFTKEELEAEELPTSFKELKLLHGYFISNHSSIFLHTGNHSHRFHRNVFPTKELAEASLALAQLLQLRDIYNGDWKPDWNDGKNKYTIITNHNSVVYSATSGTNCVMVFKSQDIRHKFFDNFKDLLEIAKPLL